MWLCVRISMCVCNAMALVPWLRSSGTYTRLPCCTLRVYKCQWGHRRHHRQRHHRQRHQHTSAPCVRDMWPIMVDSKQNKRRRTDNPCVLISTRRAPEDEPISEEEEEEEEAPENYLCRILAAVVCVPSSQCWSIAYFAVPNYRALIERHRCRQNGVTKTELFCAKKKRPKRNIAAGLGALRPFLL